ncbi:MAG: hypothetical protein V2B14_03655 [bacterium]
MFKKSVFVTAMVLATSLSSSAFAQNLALEDIQQLPSANASVVNSDKALSSDHWAYKTLENISRKYGLLIGKPGEKFDGTKPLTRNEAAVMLVNLVGKIEQDGSTLSEAEKAQLDILKQELSKETQRLVGRISNLETSVDKLQGSVSTLEKADQSGFKHDFGEKFKINGALQVQYTGNIKKGVDNYASNFSFPESEISFSGKLFPHLTYQTGLKVNRNFTSSANGLLGDAYIATDIIPHHTFYLGQSRTPIGYEGVQGTLALDTIKRAQIAANFSNNRDMGIKLAGNWKFVDYTLGAFNGNGQNTNDTTNSDLDIGSWLVFKPLYMCPQLGSLELGGGYYLGKNATYSNETAGFYSGYKYKKYAIRGEYAIKDGYTTANRRADGWYVHNSYLLTDKIQLVARFDQFDPNAKVGKDLSNEYTLGGNYFLSNQNLKLQFNLGYVDNQAGKDSERISVLTQYKF